MRLGYQTLALAAVTVATASTAFAFTPAVRKACAGDYQNFCSQYVPESTEVRRCFESNRKALSKFCVTALIDAGEVPAKYLSKK
jgi:hypothetical protein